MEIAFTFIDNIFYWIIHFLSLSTSSSSSFELLYIGKRNIISTFIYYIVLQVWKKIVYLCLISQTQNNTIAQFQHAPIFLIIILLLSLNVTYSGSVLRGKCAFWQVSVWWFVLRVRRMLTGSNSISILLWLLVFDSLLKELAHPIFTVARYVDDVTMELTHSWLQRLIYKKYIQG